MEQLSAVSRQVEVKAALFQVETGPLVAFVTQDVL